MSRPAVEVADILRAQGNRFLDRYEKSFELSATQGFSGLSNAAARRHWAAISMPVPDVDTKRPSPITPAATGREGPSPVHARMVARRARVSVEHVSRAEQAAHRRSVSGRYSTSDRCSTTRSRVQTNYDKTRA